MAQPVGSDSLSTVDRVLERERETCRLLEQSAHDLGPETTATFLHYLARLKAEHLRILERYRELIFTPQDRFLDREWGSDADEALRATEYVAYVLASVTRELSLVNRMLWMASEPREVRMTCIRLLEELATALSASCCCTFRRDPDRGVWSRWVGWCDDGSGILPAPVEAETWPLLDGIMVDQDPHLFSSKEEAPARHLADLPAGYADKAVSFVIMPLHRDHRGGQICIAAYAPAGIEFEQDEVALVKIAASVLSIALDRAFLLEAREELLSVAAHDMRTPLISILGFAKRLHRKLDGVTDPSHLEEIQIIETEGQRLLELVRSFLGERPLEEEESAHQAVFSLRQVVCEVLDELGLLAGERQQRLVCSDLSGLPDVLGDAESTRRIITNLVDNAVKHCQDGAVINLSARVEDDWVALSVSDNGPGIPAEDLPHVFEKRYRGGGEAQDQPGSGLGLSIAKHLAEEQSGYIEVESEVGEGSTFTVYIPVER